MSDPLTSSSSLLITGGTGSFGKAFVKTVLERSPISTGWRSPRSTNRQRQRVGVARVPFLDPVVLALD